MYAVLEAGWAAKLLRVRCIARETTLCRASSVAPGAIRRTNGSSCHELILVVPHLICAGLSLSLSSDQSLNTLVADSPSSSHWAPPPLSPVRCEPSSSFASGRSSPSSPSSLCGGGGSQPSSPIGLVSTTLPSLRWWITLQTV